MATNLHLVYLFAVIFLGLLYAPVFVFGEDPPNNTKTSSSLPTNKNVSVSPAPTSVPPTAPSSAVKVNVTTTTTKEPITKIKAITLLDPPFVMMSPRGDKYQGLVIDVLNEAVKKTGFDIIELDIHDQGLFGYEEHPGQWNGLIGAVQNKTADLALAAFSISSKRSTVVKFSQPFMHAGFRVLYKIPDAWHPKEAMVTLLRPFTPGLWVLIVIMFALVSLGLFIIGRYSPFEDIAFVGKTATYEGLTLANSLLYVFSSLVWQGYTAAPKSISGRILTCIWWVFSVLTIGAYIAGLCVILFKTNPEIRTLPFTTMDEMSRQNKVGIMVVRNSATYVYLNTSEGKVEKRLLALLHLNKNELIVENTEHGIDKMIQSDGKLALLMDGPAAEYITTQEPCNKMVIGEPLGFHTYGFICRNDTDLCDKLSTEILAMREDGRIVGFKEKWFQTGCLVDQPKNYIFEGLPFFDTFGGEPDAITPLTITINRFSAAFILLTLGIVVSMIVLVAEIYWAKRRGTAVPRKLDHSVNRDDDIERITNDFLDERS